MTQVRKNKPINKETNNKSLDVRFLIGNRKVLHTSNKTTYKINPEPIFINSSKKTVVFQLESSDGKKYVGKLIRPEKQIQAITQIYFLTKFKGKEICNLIDIIRKPQGIWIVSQKGHTSLFNYLDKLRQQEVKIILKNIVISYLPFYQKGIAHRDIKPGNIIIEEDLTVKFIDLELCQKIDQKYGTLNYIPPYIKQIMWDSSDSYAYGMIAKQMTEKCGLVDENLYQLIRNCLNPNSSQKWGWKQIYQFWDINPQSPTQIQSQQSQ